MKSPWIEAHNESLISLGYDPIAQPLSIPASFVTCPRRTTHALLLVARSPVTSASAAAATNWSTLEVRYFDTSPCADVQPHLGTHHGPGWCGVRSRPLGVVKARRKSSGDGTRNVVGVSLGHATLAPVQ